MDFQQVLCHAILLAHDRWLLPELLVNDHRDLPALGFESLICAQPWVVALVLDLFKYVGEVFSAIVMFVRLVFPGNQAFEFFFIKSSG